MKHGSTTHMTAEDSPPVGRHYRIAGRDLLLHREGVGAPSVVFLPGAGLVGLDFLNIHRRVAGLTTSVLYDRAGTGWSEEAEWPRTATQVAQELAALLRAANVAAPYMLVGHSLGGAYARRFAQLFPGATAGMLLLEPAHEDWNTYMPEYLHLSKCAAPAVAMPEFTDEIVAYFRAIFLKMFADWPDGIRERLVQRHLDPELFCRGLQETGTLPAVLDELRTGGPVPDVPMILITGMGIDPGQALFMSEAALADQNDAKLKLFGAVAAAAAHGEHRVLDDAAHSSIHTDQPDEVVRAIQDLLNRATRVSSVRPPGLAKARS